MSDKDYLACRHCNHEEHLNTKCYEKECDCIECHTRDDLRHLWKYESPDAVFNGA